MNWIEMNKFLFLLNQSLLQKIFFCDVKTKFWVVKVVICYELCEKRIWVKDSDKNFN